MCFTHFIYQINSLHGKDGSHSRPAYGMAFAFSLGFYQLILLETLKPFIYISNRVLSSQRIMFCVTEISYHLNPSVRITTVMCEC